MIDDDSLNESDESYFQLYSTKSVTSSFSAQLKKLIKSSVNAHVNKTNLDQNKPTKSSNRKSPVSKETEKSSRTSTDTNRDNDIHETSSKNSVAISDKSKKTEPNSASVEIDIVAEVDIGQSSKESMRNKESDNEHIASSKMSQGGETSKDNDQGVYLISSGDDESPLLTEQEDEFSTRRMTRLQSKRQGCDIQFFDQASASKNTKVKKAKKKNKTKNQKPAKRFTVAKDVIVVDDMRNDIVELEDFSTAVTEDEINYEVSVKVIWKSVHIKKFQLRRFQKFSKIYEHFMKEENVPEEKIMLTLKNVKVKSSDTPDSLNLQVFDFIEGGVLSESVNTINSSFTSANDVPEVNDDLIELKFQDSSKKTVKLKTNKHEKMKVVMIKYAEQLDVPLEKIKFYFDGDCIDPSETPVSMDLETGEVIDVKIM